MSERFETVIAGTNVFALSLFAQLTERMGTRPRIASDPSQVARLAPGAGLVILEYPGPAWLPGIQKLVAERPALRLIAGLARGLEDSIGALAALGVEAVASTDAAVLLPAVDRALGRGATPPAPPAPEAPPAPAPEDAVDVELDERSPAPDPFAVSAPVAEPEPAPAAHPSPVAIWPGNAPSLEVAEEALLEALDGTPPQVPALRPFAAPVAKVLSDLEVTVLSGRRAGFDGAVVRRAAAMRVRLAFCYASAPKAGAQVDAASVVSLLGEIDALLFAVNATLDGAPADVHPALLACRNALVKEATDFSGLTQRFVAVEVVALAAPRAAPASVARTRVLSNVARAAADERADSKRPWAWIALAAAVAMAAAYHGHDRWARSRAAAHAPGGAPAPAGFVGLPAPAGGPTVLQPTGEAASPAAIESLKETEKLKGNEVVELPGGTIVVVPGAAIPTAAERSGAK